MRAGVSVTQCFVVRARLWGQAAWVQISSPSLGSSVALGKSLNGPLTAVSPSDKQHGVVLRSVASGWGVAQCKARV